MIPCCLVFGQAAGTAAAMAVAKNTPTASVDTTALRAALIKQGAYLGE